MKNSSLRKRKEKLQIRFSNLMGHMKHFDIHTHWLTSKKTLRHVSPELVGCVMSMTKLGVRPAIDTNYDEIVNLILTKVATDVLDE